jgi:hypothetical protein
MEQRKTEIYVEKSESKNDQQKGEKKKRVLRKK